MSDVGVGSCRTRPQRGISAGRQFDFLPEMMEVLQTRLSCNRAPTDLRPTWPVILLRGLAPRPGSLRRFQADSRAGSARYEEEAGGRYVKRHIRFAGTLRERR